MQMAANVTMEEFIIYPIIHSVATYNAKVVKDNVGLGSHDYSELFTRIL